MPSTAVDSWASQCIHAKCAPVTAPVRLREASKPASWVLGEGAPFGFYRRRASSLTYLWSACRLRQRRASPGAGGASTGHSSHDSGPSTTSPSSYAGVATWPSIAAGPPADEAPPFWPALQPPFTYYASAEDAQSNTVPSGLSPMWKLLLLSDGSVTRHLQLLSGSPVTVECLSMHNVGWSLEGLPAGTELIPGPRVQRQVLLRCQPALSNLANSSTSDTSKNRCSGADSSAESSSSHGNGHGGADSDEGCGSAPGPATLLPLVYASSWWNADTVDEYLRDKSKPIWVSLSQGHVELYREVHALFRGSSPHLEQLMGCTGPFWGRHYVFWSAGRPLTLIYEVFSPRLQQYLGPAEESVGGS